MACPLKPYSEDKSKLDALKKVDPFAKHSYLINANGYTTHYRNYCAKRKDAGKHFLALRKYTLNLKCAKSI